MQKMDLILKTSCVEILTVIHVKKKGVGAFDGIVNVAFDSNNFGWIFEDSLLGMKNWLEIILS